jgi:alpha-L-rhamnosidase
MTRILRILAICLGCLALLQCAPADELQWPKVTNETKPWSRWWWLGNITTEDGLRAAMEQYAAAGLGGLEITPIYGVRGYEDRFISFLSPKWVDRLEFVLREGKRLDLGIDINHGTGWPMGGPWVTSDDTCKYVTHKTYKVEAGKTVTEPVAMRDEGVVAFVGRKRVPIADLKEPFGDNSDLQEMAIDQLRMPGPLKLVTLMAYPEKGGTALDLTDKVTDGKLDWIAPADGGTWTLYALFQGLHSRMVKRAAPGDEGHVPDHFSVDAMNHYFARFDEAFAGRDLSGLRAFFNDSYEVDSGTRTEANFTPTFFEEFQRRRGYDIRQHLPAVFATQPTDETARVLCDWRETISDLLLNNFAINWHNWAAKYGKIVRNQSHGSPANVLDLYAAVDIPETEGFGGVSMMYAASAAHVTGRRLASSETCTWLDDHFLTTLAHAKQRVDQTLLSGINHILYHGTTYSPPGDAWPGFLFYAAVEFIPTNSWWDDFHALNQYVTRCQSFLQSGKPDNDFLLYAPFHDRWMERGNGAMPHFAINGRFPAQDIGRKLLEQGYTFDLVSDRLLKNVTFADGMLHAGGNSYKALVLPETKYIPVETMQRIADLVRQGATVVLQGSLPQDVPGWKDQDERRAKLKSLADSLPEDKLISPEQLSKVGRAETMVKQGLHFIRRRDGDNRIYFIVNRGSKAIDGWVPLATSAPAAAIFDPMTGRIGRAAVRPRDLESEVYLQLAPGRSCVAETFSQSPSGAEWPCYRGSERQPLAGTWNIEFVKGGAELPAATTMDKLGSWTELGDTAKAFSGTAKYTLKFKKPERVGDCLRLDLGRVAESARVTLNGEDFGTLIAAPFSVDIPADKLRENNTLEVYVSNLMANRIADMDRRNVPWKKFYNVNVAARDAANRGQGNVFSAAKWTPRESGLIGPVTLVPLEAFDPRQAN